MTDATTVMVSDSPATQRVGPRFIFLGFNAAIDRNTVSKLLGVVGGIMERKPRPQAIILCISSEGGSNEAAFYGYEILRALPIGVGTHNVGIVASAANILFMSGNLRFAAPKTNFLFHDTKFPIQGPGTITQDELRLHVEGARTSDIKSANIIADRIGKPPAQVRRWYSEKFRSAEFALEHNVISEIRPVSIGNEDEFVQILT